MTAASMPLAGLIEDDTAIMDDSGDAFGLDDDFEAPDDTRYVSDIHNPRGKPQKMVCAWTRRSRSVCTWHGRGATIRARRASTP